MIEYYTAYRKKKKKNTTQLLKMNSNTSTKNNVKHKRKLDM